MYESTECRHKNEDKNGLSVSTTQCNRTNACELDFDSNDMSTQMERTHPALKREVVGSRLTPYEKLPSIGSSYEHTPHPPSTHHSQRNPRSKHLIKKEPIRLAIRLSDGRRLERDFLSTDTINDIIKYVRTQQFHLPDDIYLSTGDVPKRQFQNPHLTLTDAHLTTHTMSVDEENESRAHLYRSLLQYSQVFLTEIPRRESRSASVNESIISDRSALANPFITSIDSSDTHQQLLNTRKQCQQRLGVCSRKKLSLLTFQEQNDKQHQKFQKFIDDSNMKRSRSLREYQIQLKDYLLKRLECDQLKEELQQLNHQKFRLDQESKRYLPSFELIERTIPLFPPGLLSASVNDSKAVLARHRTLSEAKKFLQRRDFQKEKNDLLKEKEEFVREHNLRMTQLATKNAQLHDHLTQLEYDVHEQEQRLLFQMDLKRNRTAIIGQLEVSINYLSERYRLVHQIKKENEQSMAQKLKTIQDFILYRIDLLKRTH